MDMNESECCEGLTHGEKKTLLQRCKPGLEIAERVTKLIGVMLTTCILVVVMWRCWSSQQGCTLTPQS
jgi:hypothetical protein